MAHRVDSLRCESSDAIGAKRTCRERRERVRSDENDPGCVRPRPFADSLIQTVYDLEATKQGSRGSGEMASGVKLDIDARVIASRRRPDGFAGPSCHEKHRGGQPDAGSVAAADQN
jgi:hypothetical protein